MKVQFVLVALAALLVPTYGGLRQCAGTKSNRYETSGYLTANFTQNACKASGGAILPNRRGNQKCCSVPDTNHGLFNDSCGKQQAGDKFPSCYPTAQAC
ncbi:small cysteine-rich secretory protein SCR99 [Phytophthora cinnamomi]|uniref:small cysteine-rich secretory protein SCR99 n=1 Tax=Phytophthora cinnamomi TaxID=4785 RepID=UPI00355A0E97|nr:small cysteine-rich secretory protein SCR99 [Phytophthora cinnamomi]